MKFLIRIALIVVAAHASLVCPREAGAREPVLVHIPSARMDPGNAEYLVHARFDGSWSGRSLELMVRRAGESGFVAVPFLAEGEERFVARLAGSWVRPPGLEYYVRSIEPQGTERVRFASASTPHYVVVDPTRADQRRTARLARHANRQTEFSARFDHFNFGAIRQRHEQA